MVIQGVMNDLKTFTTHPFGQMIRFAMYFIDQAARRVKHMTYGVRRYLV